MMFFQVEEDKIDKISEHLETSVHALDKAMRCIAELKHEGLAGQRMMGGMSGQRHWANQYGSGYSGRREYMGGGYGGQREFDTMPIPPQVMGGQRMPMPQDPMYY